VANEFIDAIAEPLATRVEANHVDGKDSVLRRSQMLDWLKEGAPEDDNTCRILSNARCLSEGVDVPALDAVLFLNPRDSVVDVVQSVGRVMRKSDGKKYGYIILPIAIPAGQSPQEALNDNTNYKVVWQVLQALRAHDDRFNAMVNKIELNKRKPPQVQIIGVGGGRQRAGADDSEGEESAETAQIALDLQFFEQWREAIYAKIVDKVGDRRYWDTWAQDIADIAETHIVRMQKLLAHRSSEPSQAFDTFLERLHEEINPSVSRDDAIEMLAQHLITRPVFEALFASNSLELENPVSQAMQEMLDALNENTLEGERTTLERFYRSVQQRAAGIDNAEGRQRIVIELYDKFFRNAFPKMAERLGIVYTPVEVVDYLLHSADYVLRKHFGKGLTDEGVHVLDPFTGTGTFITRLLQSGLIKKDDAARKFEQELHANELVLLAYYIAAVNIEMVYQEAFGGEYRPFEGIVWTDTFQMSENEQVSETDDGVQFKIMELNGSENSERAIKQARTPIRVIVGNPPYSARQRSTADQNKNLDYPQLDLKVKATYGDSSKATNKNALRDSYIRAIRWASDRIGDNGVISFITNAGFLDGNAMDGMRSCLAEEFSSIWILNARGNQRTSGEMSRREGGKIFGSGSRAPIALTLLVKDPAHEGLCEIHYHDIGDYVSREEKLEIIKGFGSVAEVPWQPIKPNPQNDWINHRDVIMEKFVAIGERTKPSEALFEKYSMGAQSVGDTWFYNSSRIELMDSIKRSMNTHNAERKRLSQSGNYSRAGLKLVISDLISDPTKIRWTDAHIKLLNKGLTLEPDESRPRVSMYRPFFRQWLYFDPSLLHRPGMMKEMFPSDHADNRVLTVTGKGATKEFSALMYDVVPDLEMISKGQAFPLYWYEEKSKTKRGTANQPTLIPELEETRDGFVRHDGINNLMLDQYRQVYADSSITKEDIFYYVYGVLHSPEYRERFEADLKKMLPRIPFTEDFWAFSNAGRELGEMHVGYESVEPWPVTETRTKMPLSGNGQTLDDKTLYRVTKMKWAGGARTPDKSIIVYNEHFTLSDIPLEAYDYIVNGKSAIEWIMERYAVTQDKDSKIVNDPNEWSDDPRYIIDLVKRIVRVSLDTNRIVASLPALNERDVEIKPGAMATFH
jgi:predicted helicase